MNKTEIVKSVAESLNLPASQVDRTLEAILDKVGRSLRSGDTVDLKGFGRFSSKTMVARPGRNPKTGEVLEIAEHQRASFKPSKMLLTRDLTF